MSAYAPPSGVHIRRKGRVLGRAGGADEDVFRKGQDNKIIIGACLNGHIGRGNIGYERWHGGFGHGEKNQEGDTILEFTQAYHMALETVS